MSDTPVTLYLREFDMDGGDLVYAVGQFRRIQWCKTHADWSAKHINPSESTCRWSKHVLADKPKKPCVLVEVWQEIPR